jgi:tetratricopeptide (TPR) repeat protein
MTRIRARVGGTAVLVLHLLVAAGDLRGQPPVTFSEAIAPILDAHCVSCHRPGGAGPFSLIEYESARARAPLILTMTSRRAMPPWKPTEPIGAFRGERRLTAEQIAMIARWVAAGAPEGPAIERPRPADHGDGWQLGPPDLVVSLEAYTLPAGTGDIYRKFVLPVPLKELRWIRAVDIRPGASHAIHHARVMLDATGQARDLAAADPLPGYDGFMADSASFPGGHVLGWAPGKMPTAHPDALSWPLAPGTDLVLQLHMLPQAEPIAVRPEVGLYFARTPATLQPVALMLNAMTIDIPAGDAAHVVRDRYRLPVPVRLLAIYPHAHYIAREIHATATLPDGSERMLLRIDDWDYNWQDEYRYLNPVRLPAGTEIAMRYVYDNSAANPRNPHSPPQPIRFGPKATDEMAQLMLQVLTDRPADRDVLMRSLQTKGASDEILGYLARLRRDPNDHSSRTGLGARYLELGQVDVAFKHLQEAIRLAPDFPDAQYNLGAALLAQGKIEEAIAAYQKAIELDPNYAEAHNNLGVLLESSNPADAVTHYRRAIEIQPHLADAHANLASALAVVGRSQEAIAHYREALSSQPAQAEWRAKLGRALMQAGQRSEASVEYRRALSADPRLGAALVDLAWLLATAPERQLRNTGEAVSLALRAMKIVGENHPLVLDALAASYAADGQFDRAVTMARQAAARARAIPEFHSRAADIDSRVRLYEAHQPYRLPQ